MDRDSRTACAALLRRLMIGQLTGDEFECAVDELGSSDPGIRAVRTQAWACYSEGEPVDRDFARAVRQDIARSILFLQSDAEYLWPPYVDGGPNPRDSGGLPGIWFFLKQRSSWVWFLATAAKVSAAGFGGCSPPRRSLQGAATIRPVQTEARRTA